MKAIGKPCYQGLFIPLVAQSYIMCQFFQEDVDERDSKSQTGHHKPVVLAQDFLDPPLERPQGIDWTIYRSHSIRLYIRTLRFHLNQGGGVNRAIRRAGVYRPGRYASSTPRTANQTTAQKHTGQKHRPATAPGR